MHCYMALNNVFYGMFVNFCGQIFIGFIGFLINDNLLSFVYTVFKV